ncbi:signal transduction histidine kinase [Pseudomonas sp. SJZ103]|jgi:two-component system OmpR family sensor kinase|uniref:HAMP domain-containing sensor histidine kinase n=1 Tax=unclassified Pseudomonas TaxID=196821 RepID=UPI00119ED497|nr:MULTISPECIES: ATP-binding protein [unclassified Pseudomonas]MBB6286430.1 signal transduction histidine kinase [Pseudomonas sp. SJZ073]MBB6311645.1 signal transduction histidine kinase [Pseudomonas sp. JAI120]MCS4313120.1 signal transduction histidine kinase [Pseudomonas sp. BIGb0381]NJJ59225.1 HAMP domain-containing protein [Pseudomonas sp. B14(2022)]TWC70742.1 signal transduction histidine kinase [Pseudomonas sp. SJZ103]
MTRPSLLFWKLFLAFWLATTLTFLVGVGVLELGRFQPNDPHVEAMLAAEDKLLQQFGVEAGGQLLAVWERPADEAIGVYNSAGQLLIGGPVAQPVYERAVVSKEGLALSIRSTHAPGNPPDRPWHQIPLIIGTLMSALFSGYMAYYLAWPLAYLKRAMGDAAQGRFETRVKPAMGKRRDEIVDLAEDCDRMANQLKVLVEAQQQLLHDISHELRSPLTRMQAAIGLLRQDAARLEMLERIERESERMDTLIEALLTLARLQGRPESIEREPVDIVELLAMIVDDAQFEAGIKGCRVHLQACPPFIACVSGELLYRCFENVIRNAVRYTRPDTTVGVSAQVNPDANRLTVQITDQGPGVHNDRLRSIFQPFERGVGDASVGFGLGLAIAARAVQMHGGNILARNEPGGGLTVEITLHSARSLHDITLA